MAITKIKTAQPGIFRWEVYLATDGRGSKRIRRRFDKRIDAERFLESYKSDLRKCSMNGSSTDFESTTLKLESEYWLNHSRLKMSPGGYDRAKGCMKNLLEKYGDIPAIRLTVARISEIQNDLLKMEKAPRTVNREIGMIKAVLNFSARHGRLPYNPALHARPLPVVKTKMGFWEPEEAQAFLRFADEKYPKEGERRWIYIAYLIALNTGMRCGEIWGLQVKDLQKNRDLIHVSRQYDYFARALRPCKGKSERYVPCHPILRGELECWIEQRRLSRDRLIFTGKFGDPVEAHSFKRHFFEKDLRESGARAIRFHDLRHTAATLMIAGGIDLPTVQSILDHKDITTTMQYVHLLGDSIQKVAGRFAVLPETTTQTGAK